MSRSDWNWCLHEWASYDCIILLILSCTSEEDVFMSNSAVTYQEFLEWKHDNIVESCKIKNEISWQKLLQLVNGRIAALKNFSVFTK